MAGAEVVFALNHSPLAIKVHNENHPNAAHLRVDAQRMTNEQIQRTPDSGILIAGAPCPNHSLAKEARSRKQKPVPLFDENGNPTDATEPLAEGVEERSRATLNEICYIEVDCREDEEILRHCLGERVQVVSPANQALAQ
jgi:site-specific DNA-cytosine methylase